MSFCFAPGEPTESPEYLSMCSKAQEDDQREQTRVERQQGLMNEQLRSSSSSTITHNVTPNPPHTSRCAKVTKTPESLGHEGWSFVENPKQLRSEASKPFPWRTWSDLVVKKRLDDLDKAREIHRKKFQATLDSLIEEFESGVFAARMHSSQTQEEEMDILEDGVSKDGAVPQLMRVSFRVHYITQSPNQQLAVTGNQQELGAWKRFVLLQEDKNGYWANTITLSAESEVEWKFVLVENGKIQHWEECGNRQLVLPGKGEEIQLHCTWACH